MATVKAPNFTPAQEQRIRDFAAENGANVASATVLSAEMGKSPRSLIAKMVRMELGYVSKQPTTKSGDPVTSKTDLVASIATIVSGNLDGLEKAPKAALHALARFANSHNG